MATTKNTDISGATASCPNLGMKKETGVHPLPREKASFLREAFAAALGGTIHSLIESPLVMPIEASITQTQLNGLGFVKNFAILFKQRALYRSLPAALVAAPPKAITHYSLLTFWINMLTPEGKMDNKVNVKQAMLVGTMTGFSEVWISSPLSFIKFRMQRPEWGYSSMTDAITKIYNTEGLRAFWKGTGATFVRNSICMAGMLGSYQYLEQQLPVTWNKNTRHMVAGMAGGVLGSLASYPFEMIRAAKQHNVPFWEQIASKGPKRLLAGWAPGAARLVVTSTIMGMLIPKLKGFSDMMKFDKKKIEVTAVKEHHQV